MTLNVSSFVRFYLLVIVFSLAGSCNNHGYNAETVKQLVVAEKTGADTEIDESAPECYAKSDLDLLDSTGFHEAMRTISEIREVRDDSKQNPDQIIYCMTETDSNDVYQSNSYQIRVMLETKTHYCTRFNFYVSKETKEIKIYDAVTDSLMSVEDWRKAQ